MIEFGNPPALKYDPDTQTLSVRIREPDNDSSLLELIKEQIKLANVTKANLCLSGGVDSQFVLRVLKDMNVPTTAYTYLSTWQGSPINTEDVVYAQILAKRNNIELKIIELDLYEFFNSNKHLEYCKKYSISSPQVAVHLYFLETTFKDVDGTVLLGGEVPLMIKNSKDEEGPLDIAGVNASFISRYTVAYHRLAESMNIKFVRDLLYFTPAIIYKTLELSINLVEKYQIHCEKEDNQNDMSAHKLKYAIYEEIIPGGIRPLMKATGFEPLKKYLASSSGIYNTFDLKYRVPMEIEHRKQLGNTYNHTVDSDSISSGGKVRYSAGDIPKQLTDRYRAAIDKHESKCIYEYYFDF